MTERPKQEIICADATLVRTKFDHVICDPPYSPHVHKNASSMRGGKAGKNDLGFAPLTPLLRATIAHGISKASGWCLVFSDWEGLAAWKRDIEDSGAEYVRAIPWVRWSMPQLSGDRPPQGSECVILAHPGGKKLNYSGPGNITHFDFKCLRGSEKHPTEKSLEFMLALVSWFTPLGSHVGDYTAGSGSTGQACRLLGRSFTGYELQKSWAVSGQERIASGQLSLRDAKGLQDFLARQKLVEADKKRTKEHTAKIRAKRDAGK